MNVHCFLLFIFFFNDTATTEIYTLSLHDALPICTHFSCGSRSWRPRSTAPGHTSTRPPQRSGTTRISRSDTWPAAARPRDGHRSAWQQFELAGRVSCRNGAGRPARLRDADLDVTRGDVAADLVAGAGGQPERGLRGG